MHVYRSFFLKLISGLTNARIPTCAPTAPMSTGPAGQGGENLMYIALVGAACLGGGIYVSKIRLSHRTLKNKQLIRRCMFIIFILLLPEHSPLLAFCKHSCICGIWTVSIFYCLFLLGIPNSQGRQRKISGPY